MTTCATCGASRGSFIRVGDVWHCLKHLPSMRRRANRDARKGAA